MTYMTDSEKEIYKQTYSNKLSERKFKYFLGCTIVTGVIVAVVLGGALKSFSMMFLVNKIKFSKSILTPSSPTFAVFFVCRH